MLILASDLKKCPIISPESGKVGELGEPIVDPATGQILGFYVKSGKFLAAIRVISIVDILALDQRVVIINNVESIVSPDEIVRVKSALGQIRHILGTNAYTESGLTLGKVNDLLINTEPIAISRYYLRHLWQDRIIAADKVTRITHRGVYFCDDIAATPATPESVPA